MRKLISEVKLSSLVPVSTKADCVPRLLLRAYNLSHDTKKTAAEPLGFRPSLTQSGVYGLWRWLKGSDLGRSGSLLSVYAVQPCGYATLFLQMQKSGFLMTRLISLKPKINIT